MSDDTNTIDRLLADLDAEQRLAVTTESQLVAVIAGAGSGKTRVLTRRVAYRIASGSAEPRHTLVLTFTREAAGELRRRLPRLGLAQRVEAGTFHSIAQGLLRQRWLDRDERPRSILPDRRALVRELAGGDALDALVAEVDFASARGLGPEGYTAAVQRGERRSPVDAARVAATLDAYSREKRRRGVIDLDDLLGLTIEAIERDPEFAEAVRWRFRHLLVDEAQDLNPLQHRLVDLLRAGRDDVFLVGDPAQAIYGFTGSDPGLLLDVSERFPGIEVVRLPTNHRSTPQIVDAGAHALATDGQAAVIRSGRPDGPAVTIESHTDEQAEARRIASRLARLDPGLVREGRAAVLARTHAALEATRAALATADVPVRGPAIATGSPLASLLREAYQCRTGDALRRWLHDQREQIEADGEPRAEVVEAVADFVREQPTGDGTALRIWVDTTDPFGRRSPGVELLTFHAAKGREWHTVHLVGCETGLVPHRSATTNAARAEEARLFYVALTRATDSLVVHWAERRNGYQRRRTPLLAGFDGGEPEPVPPPDELVARSRAPGAVTLDRLHAWRDATARAGGILPDAVCTDKTLAIIAEHAPASPDELDALTGMGTITSRRLFDGIHAALTGADRR